MAVSELRHVINTMGKKEPVSCFKSVCILRGSPGRLVSLSFWYLGIPLTEGRLIQSKAVHWFNPLVWIMQKEAEVDIELSCDEKVTQGADYAARRAYTETLLSALHKQKARKTVLSLLY